MKQCEEYQEVLTLYVLKDLDETSMTEIRLHLAQCEACRLDVDELASTIGLVREALSDTASQNHELDPGKIEGITRTRGKTSNKNLVRWLVASHPVLKVAASLAIILGLVAFWLIPDITDRRAVPLSITMVEPEIDFAAAKDEAMELLEEIAEAEVDDFMVAPGENAPAPEDLEDIVLDQVTTVSGTDVNMRGLNGSRATWKYGNVVDYDGNVTPGLSADAPAEPPPPAQQTPAASAPRRPALPAPVVVAAPASRNNETDQRQDVNDRERLDVSGSISTTVGAWAALAKPEGNAKEEILGEKQLAVGADSGWFFSRQKGQAASEAPADGRTGGISDESKLVAASGAERDRLQDVADQEAGSRRAPARSATPPGTVPILGDVPVLGRLFVDNDTSEDRLRERSVNKKVMDADSMNIRYEFASGEAGGLLVNEVSEAGGDKVGGDDVGIDESSVLSETANKPGSSSVTVPISFYPEPPEPIDIAARAEETVTEKNLAPEEIENLKRDIVTKNEKEAEESKKRENDVKDSEREGQELLRFRATGVNPYIDTVDNAFSTFAIDVDTASYHLARRYLQAGLLPPAESVRTEEFVNAFDYQYPAPASRVFRMYADAAPSPFGHGQHMLRIGVKGRRLGREEQRPAVLTFVVDASGSMDRPDRMGLVKQSLKLLVEQLAGTDQAAIVQYGTDARLVLAHTPATQKSEILAGVAALQCGGATDLEQGLLLAYKVAAENFVSGAENRVILLSDGVANMGEGSAETILEKIAAYREQGITCSVYGFGVGNYDDVMLETLANKGDGVYTFIGSEEDSRRAFVDELAASLNMIAKDVKIQVEFNPAQIARYRQLGYENRQLTKQDFRNDAIDAGEVGSGQTVTALYETDLSMRKSTARWQSDSGWRDPDVLAIVRVRFQHVPDGRIEEIEHEVRLADIAPAFDAAPARFRLAVGVAEFAEILRGSPHATGSSFEGVANVLRSVASELHLDPQVQELARFAELASGFSRTTEKNK